MSDTSLSAVFPTVTKMLYVYDFLNLWTFFIELIETDEPKPGNTYPMLIFSHGEVPEEAPEKTFSSDKEQDEFSGNGLDDLGDDLMDDPYSDYV